MIHKIRQILPIFLVGLVIGLILNKFSTNDSTKSLKRAVQDVLYESKTARDFHKIKKIRILCMLNTSPWNHRRAIHIKRLWGKNCDKLLFASTITDINLGIMGFDIPDKHYYVWAKEKRMIQYVYKNFFDKYDWFYKADDDSFAIMENLRYFLHSYSSEDPLIFGYKFNTTAHRWGYFSGGAGK